jgi:hypothetical protein
VRSTLFVAAATVAFVVIAASVGFVVYFCYDPGPPPILGTIRCHNGHDCNKASADLTALLQKRFQVGTPASDLETALTNQGFRRLPENENTKCVPSTKTVPSAVARLPCPPWDPNWSPRNELVYYWGRWAKLNRVTVDWSTDATGRITYVEGYFSLGTV